MYRELASCISFIQHEEEILAFWEKHSIFQKSVQGRQACPQFVFYDGPPGTNGYPHIGHMFQSVLKDLWPRYKTMQGYQVIRRAGWDTHGLPVELRASKDLQLDSKQDIQKYGVENFVKYCSQTVFRYKQEWVQSIRRVGRFVDFEHEYATLTNDFIQSVWWILKQAWQRGLLYNSYKVLAYCPRLGTSLSNNEVAQGYRKLHDLSVFVKFPVSNGAAGSEVKSFFLVWTTTPWTLLGNLALAVGPDIEYVEVLCGDEAYILGRFCVESLHAKGYLPDYRIVRCYKGSELTQLSYEALWPFFSYAVNEKQCSVLADEYVSVSEGTGIVHLSVYGEDDYRLLHQHNIRLVFHVNLEGRFVAECGHYSGRLFDEEGLDREIAKELLLKNRLLAKERIEHNYPCNYRTGTRLIYYPKATWFLKTTAYKDQMCEINKSITWYPSHVRDGRFGKWLEQNVDWAISRERFWGTPLPIWTCEQCRYQVCIESIKELNEYSAEQIAADIELHIPYIDTIILQCTQCSGKMKREPEVLDCWFDAGAMPWGQFGYPHKEGAQAEHAQLYPADFICEGQDQTRGWFYTLLALSTMLTGQSSYKNVICTELVLDEQGQKMSKSLGNVVDSMELLQQYGADAFRWFALSSGIIGQSISFSEERVKDIVKTVLLPLWNCYKFFVSYANIDGYVVREVGVPESLVHSLDVWIVSEVQGLVEKVRAALDAYNPVAATQEIECFVDKLSNWYIRRSRRRFWKTENDHDKSHAYQTLYYALVVLIQVSAPFVPFITEAIYQNLVRSVNLIAPESIHLCEYPSPNNSLRNTNIEYEMSMIQELVSLGRSLRSKHQIKIRQPLAEMVIILHTGDLKDEKILRNMQSLIQDELNVKKISFTHDTQDLLELKVQANLKRLGPKLKDKLALLQPLISNLRPDEIQKLESGGVILLDCEQPVQLEREDILVQRNAKKTGIHVSSSPRFTIAFDTNLNLELIQEGLVREFINKVQFIRKELQFHIMDRINIDYFGSNLLHTSIEQWKDFIKHETLALKINHYQTIHPQFKEYALNNEKAFILVTKL